jgi:hypothetical protein
MAILTALPPPTNAYIWVLQIPVSWKLFFFSMQGERPTVHPPDSDQRSVGVSDENEKNVTTYKHPADTQAQAKDAMIPGNMASMHAAAGTPFMCDPKSQSPLHEEFPDS